MSQIGQVIMRSAQRGQTAYMKSHLQTKPCPSSIRPSQKSHLPGRDMDHTLRRLGGRQPLCGIGVTSRMLRTSIPAAASARIADSRPEPGPETRTSTARTPWSRAALAALTAACCAANGVPLREPRKPSEPEDFHDSVLPCWSVMVTMVLLNVAWIKTSPNGTFLRSRFLNFLFLPTFAAPAVLFWVFAMAYLVTFFLPATVPLRGPLRVRALVWVRWPRTGSERR